MSSTTGFQNLLVNVFRPVYRYEIPTGDSNSIFVPKLEMSNIDTYSGNSVSVFTAAVGDVSGNVYVGSNAGNVYTANRGCQYVSAFGYGAASNICNVTNSVILGYNAGASASNASSNVAVGNNASANGTSNVRIGSSNVGTGSGNVSIGTASSTASYSNCILLGAGVTATDGNQFRVGSAYLYGDLSTNWLGVGTPTPMDTTNGKFDVSGNVNIDGQVGINKIPVRTLDLNGDFRAVDATGTLDFHSGSFTVTAAFKQTLSSTAITQPIIQYGKASGSGNSGSTSVTLPTAYSDATYVVQVTMGDTDPAEMAVNNVSSNSFTIYWAAAGSGTHSLNWTTFGT